MGNSQTLQIERSPVLILNNHIFKLYFVYVRIGLYSSSMHVFRILHIIHMC